MGLDVAAEKSSKCGWNPKRAKLSQILGVFVEAEKEGVGEVTIDLGRDDPSVYEVEELVDCSVEMWKATEGEVDE